MVVFSALPVGTVSVVPAVKGERQSDDCGKDENVDEASENGGVVNA